MIYKNRCEYAQAPRRGGALYCTRVDGFCAFQYRCELTGQYENTPTAARCKAKRPKPACVAPEPVSAYVAPPQTQPEPSNIDVKSERSPLNDALEQPANQVACNPRPAKRGRRKKSADLSADAAQKGAD